MGSNVNPGEKTTKTQLQTSWSLAYTFIFFSPTPPPPQKKTFKNISVIYMLCRAVQSFNCNNNIQDNIQNRAQNVIASYIVKSAVVLNHHYN